MPKTSLISNNTTGTDVVDNRFNVKSTYYAHANPPAFGSICLRSFTDDYSYQNTTKVVTRNLLPISDYSPSSSQMGVAAPVVNPNVFLVGHGAQYNFITTIATMGVIDATIVTALESLGISLSSENSSLSFLINAIDSLSSQLSELVSFNREISTTESISVGLLDINLLNGVIEAVDTLSVLVSEVSNTLNIVTANDSVTMVEGQEIRVFLDTLDGLVIALGEIRQLYCSFGSLDTVDLSTLGSASIVDLKSSLDSITMLLQYSNAFFKNITLSDDILVRDNVSFLKNTFSTQDTLSVIVSELQNSLLFLSKSDFSNVSVSEDTRNDLFLRVTENLSVNISENLMAVIGILVTIQKNEVLGLLSEADISDLWNLASSIDDIECSVQEAYDILASLYKLDDISVAFPEQLENLLISLPGFEDVLVIENLNDLDVAFTNRQDSILVKTEDHTRYNYPIKTLVKRAATIMAQLYKIQYVALVNKTEYHIEIKKKA
jgi:hypothetical protein